MHYSSLENQLFLLQAIHKTNKDFEDQCIDEHGIDNKSIYVLDTANQLISDLESIDTRLNKIQD